MPEWPSDAAVDRALVALEAARVGTRGPIPRQAMRKALIAGVREPRLDHPPACECAECWQAMEGNAR
jgi:hypothetical protein